MWLKLFILSSISARVEKQDEQCQLLFQIVCFSVLGMDKIESYHKLAKRVEGLKFELNALLKGLKREGKTIAGYGAPAKGNTLLQYADIGPDILDYLTEALPTKIGFLSPGMHIPVVNIEEARKNPPDYFVMLAWNYRDKETQISSPAYFAQEVRQPVTSTALTPTVPVNTMPVPPKAFASMGTSNCTSFR